MKANWSYVRLMTSALAVEIYKEKDHKNSRAPPVKMKSAKISERLA